MVSKKNKSQGMLDMGTKGEIPEGREENKSGADKRVRLWSGQYPCTASMARCKPHKRCLGSWGYVGATGSRPIRRRGNLNISQKESQII